MNKLNGKNTTFVSVEKVNNGFLVSINEPTEDEGLNTTDVFIAETLSNVKDILTDCFNQNNETPKGAVRGYN